MQLTADELECKLYIENNPFHKVFAEFTFDIEQSYYDDGYQDGKENGYDNGYSEGYNIGYLDAENELKE